MISIDFMMVELGRRQWDEAATMQKSFEEVVSAEDLGVQFGAQDDELALACKMNSNIPIYPNK